MRSRTTRILLALLTLAMPAVAPLAADTRVDAPGGWTALEPVDTAGGHTVLTLADRAGGYALTIHRHGDREFVDLPAEPVDVRLSPDGGTLLVRLAAGPEGTGCHGTTLLATTEGRILRQLDDGRRVDFSSSGGALLAWEPPGRCAAGSQLEVRDAGGGAARIYDAGLPIDAAVAVGRGGSVVLAHGATLRRVDLDRNAEEAWRVELPAGATAIRALHGELLDVAFADGRRRLLDTAGETIFDWNPAVLAERFGGKPRRYSAYRPYAGARRDEAIWFDGGERGFRLDLPTGRLAPVRLDASPPRGYAAAEGVRDGKLVFLDPAGALVRELTVD